MYGNNSNLTQKGKELMELLEPELRNFRLREVVDYEVDYIRRGYEYELAEKDKALSEMNDTLSEMDNTLSEINDTLYKKEEEISILKAKLKENGIDV